MGRVVVVAGNSSNFCNKNERDNNVDKASVITVIMIKSHVVVGLEEE